MTNIEKITEILNKYTEPQYGDYYLHGCIMNGQLEDLAEEIVKKFDLCAVVSCICKTPEPRLKVSENGTYSYCNNCSKTYWQK